MLIKTDVGFFYGLSIDPQVLAPELPEHVVPSLPQSWEWRVFAQGGAGLEPGGKGRGYSQKNRLVGFHFNVFCVCFFLSGVFQLNPQSLC